MKLLKSKNYMSHPIYGKIYFPYYDKHHKFLSSVPELYKKDVNGNFIKQEVFFLRDNYFPFSPYINSNYFIFDRYNFSLDTHFYTHEAMLETMGAPKRRFGLFVESESIVPKSFQIFNKNRNLYKDFNAIFTFSDHILDSVPNAKFYPYCAGVWYNDPCVSNLNIQERLNLKSKNVSIVSSNKKMCDLHKFRIDVANMCLNESLADTFGTFRDGSSYVNINDTLTKYRFFIAIENDVTSYFFTEKITNCFASLTIPIYLGAKAIGKFFNKDGIIEIDTKSDIKKVLSKCTPEFYNERINAILDNYNRVQEYKNIWDYLYKHYLK